MIQTEGFMEPTKADWNQDMEGRPIYKVWKKFRVCRELLRREVYLYLVLGNNWKNLEEI